VEIPFSQREKDVKGGGFELGKHVHLGYIQFVANETVSEAGRLGGLSFKTDAIDWNFMRLLRWTARAVGAALVGFHAWLLATQWSAGRLFNDPALLMRWAAALVLAAALIWLGREGTSLVSRKAIVIWLLAALLHAPAVADRNSDLNALQTLPETVATLLLQTTAVAGVIGAAMLALWLVAGIFRRRNTSHAAWSFVRVLSLSASPHDGFGLVGSARPPPNSHR